MGVASPLGITVEDFWKNLLDGDTGVATLTDIDLSKCRTKFGAPVRGFDPEEHFSHRERKRLSRATQMGLLASDQVMAGLDSLNGDPYRRGVIIGSSIAGYSAAEAHFKDYFAGPAKGNPFVISKVMNIAPGSNMSIRYGFKGPLVTTDAACASAAQAVGFAYQQIQHGYMDMALVGGADTSLTPAVMQAWSKMRVLSERNENPPEACRPFSRDRDGIVLGEGAGVLLVESESSARGRGAEILAEVSGYAATSDGHHITQPSEEGPSEAMRLALENAGIAPEEVDYINAHATATQWNDKNETSAIKKALGEHAYDVPVVGIKAAIGHSIAASGALELISVVLSIRDNIVPPTINVFEPDPDCDLDYVTEGKRAVEINHAVSNSFAFGGSNAVVVVSRYPGS